MFRLMLQNDSVDWAAFAEVTRVCVVCLRQCVSVFRVRCKSVEQ